jgi:methyltransferase (TIGR00027 family)
VRNAVLRVIDSRWPGVRTSLIARTRLIDELVEAAAPSFDQLVILGAGFDSRAWRLDGARRVDRVFEVDHPDTQRRKREVLERRGVSSDHVRFVPTNFHQGELAIRMSDEGYDAETPALLLWEGTSNYLDEPAVDATLRWCATAAAGTKLIFTYINRDVLTDPTRYHGAARMQSTLARSNERMTFGLDPTELSVYLADRGLVLRSDVGAAQYREQYYGSQAMRMRGHEFYRVACADVSPTTPAATSRTPQHARQL